MRFPGGRWASELEPGLLAVAGLYVALQATGGARSPLGALAFAFAAFVSSLYERPVGLALVMAAASMEFALYAASARSASDAAVTGGRVALLALFALLHRLFLAGLAARLRREHAARLERAIRDQKREAREFRLIAPALSQSLAPAPARTRGEHEQMLAQGSVETIHQGLFYVVDLLRKSLGLQTCLVLWLGEDELLRIREAASDSDRVVETPIPGDAGALGVVVRDRVPLQLARPKAGHLPYYRTPERVGAFAAVPILEAGHLRGVVVADRREERPFDPRDEALLVGAAEQAVRIVQGERVFGAVERSKYEHERFYRASEMLNRALTLEQVFDVAFAAAREIVDFDFAAITLYDRASRRHSVARVAGTPPKGLHEGESFGDNAGLTAMVVKNRHHLPATGELRDKSVPVFTRRVRLQDTESLLVLPLICADDAIGTLAVAARRSGAFPKDRREMLGVIANQVAVSVRNAQMYQRMEELATTDGLTALTNHRAFQERAAEMLERAVRHDKRCAFLLTDIDHFKRVNDTYGHPVGDEVLRRVARVLAGNARRIDLVARYGGEEFALVLEETDAAGARQLAERVRSDVAQQEFAAPQGPFRVTISLGIAAYPEHAQDKQALLERADQALYEAKRSGRDRVVVWSPGRVLHLAGGGGRT